MYRAVTWLALHRGVDLDDEAAVAELARAHPVALRARRPAPSSPHACEIAGEDVTRAIRTPEVDAAVSIVAGEPGVREAMVAQQRRCALAEHDCVVEGRDIGTVVFPDAAVKVFLTASAEERARRRHGQHTPRRGTVAAASEAVARAARAARPHRLDARGVARCASAAGRGRARHDRPDHRRGGRRASSRSCEASGAE